jgi:hypothetical protein
MTAATLFPVLWNICPRLFEVAKYLYAELNFLYNNKNIA